MTTSFASFLRYAFTLGASLAILMRRTSCDFDLRPRVPPVTSCLADCNILQGVVKLDR